MSKAAFLATYRAELLARYPWTTDMGKLEQFMSNLSDGLDGKHNRWAHEGEAIISAWKAIGGKGKPRRKDLLALA